MTAKPVLPRMTRPKRATPNLLRAPKSRGLSILGQISDEFMFKDSIATSVLNYNLFDQARAKGWNGKDPLVATVTVEASGIIGAANTSTYGFDTGLLSKGSRVALVNKGYIVGAGGNGLSYSSSGNAGNGGPALRAQAPMVIDNLGVIGGGGGGGDRGKNREAGGGGGAGSVPGTGGTSYLGDVDLGTYNGGTGTLTGGGGGGRSYYVWEFGEANDGGMGGGALGASGGETGGNSTGPGAGGAAVVGNDNITWVATGTRYGAVS